MTSAHRITANNPDPTRNANLLQQSVRQIDLIHGVKTTEAEVEHWAWRTPQGTLQNGFRVKLATGGFVGVRFYRRVLYDNCEWVKWSGKLPPGTPPPMFDFNDPGKAKLIQGSIQHAAKHPGTEYRIYYDRETGSPVGFGLHTGIKYREWLLFYPRGLCIAHNEQNHGADAASVFDYFRYDNPPPPTVGVWSDGGLFAFECPPQFSDPDRYPMAYALQKIKALAPTSEVV